MPTDDERKSLNSAPERGEHKLEKTTQKTANESVTDAPMAKKYQANFESYSHGTRAINPLILEDSATGKTYYDASKTKPSREATHNSHRAERSGVESSDKKVSKLTDAITIGASGNLIDHSFTAYLPDYKTIGIPATIPRVVAIEISPSDNVTIEKHFNEILNGRDRTKLSEFDRDKLHNLAVCDTFIDKYQQALSKQELKDVQSLPVQMRGMFLAGQALEDGAALGATRAVLHKVIDEGAIGDLASGTAMGLAFGKVVAKLAANVNPITKGIAVALQTGGLMLAVKQFGDIGHAGINGFLTSVPDLQKLIDHPTESNFANAKEKIDKHLGPPLADAALVGLGVAAAHGLEKVTAGSGKPGATHEQTQENPKSNSGEHSGEEVQKVSSKGDRVHESDKHRHASLNHDFIVEGEVDSPIRTLKFDGGEKKFMCHNGFVTGEPYGSSDSWIKLHVFTESAADLAHVQSKLVPEIYKDPVLKDNISSYKMIDPLFGLNKKGITNMVEPTGKDQGAKGFTIYTKTPEQAALVQRRLDEICQAKGLGLEHKLDTGNCETVSGLSNRIGISRDTFLKVEDNFGNPGCRIDAPVESKIHDAFNLRPGEKLNDSQLLLLEKQTGIRHGLLTYSEHGHLMLKIPDHKVYHGGLYAPEAGAGKAFGELDARPALYALYHKFHFDPADVSVVPPMPPKPPKSGNRR